MIQLLPLDYYDIGQTAKNVFDLVLLTYRNYHLDAKTMLHMEDIQDEIANRMVDDYLYIDTKNPCIQDYAEKVGELDWTDEENDEWEELSHKVYLIMKEILKTQIFDYTASH